MFGCAIGSNRSLQRSRYEIVVLDIEAVIFNYCVLGAVCSARVYTGIDVMNFFTAEVEIDVDSRGLPAQLARVKALTSRVAMSIQGAFKKMATRVISSVKRMVKYAVAGLLAIGVAATKMAMDAQESENLFEESMGNMAAAARKWSVEMADALYLNEYEVRKVVATFNVMFDSMGLGERAAYDMAKGLTQLSYDMASFYNLKPAEAFQKLQAGITGEAEPLKRLGILINETTVKQYAMNESIWDGVGKMTEMEKVQARYGLILQQTKKAQGDMERTLDSSTNVFRSLWSLIKETGIGIGNIFIPAVTDAGIVLRDWLSESQQRIIEGVIRGIERMVLAVRYFTSEVRLLPAYWKSIQIEVTKVAIAIWKTADAMTNLDEVFAWIRGDTETYKNIIMGLESEIKEYEREIQDLAQTYAESDVVVNKFFDSLIAGLRRVEKEPDFITTFPAIVRFEDVPSWEEIIEGMQDTPEALEEIVDKMKVVREETYKILYGFEAIGSSVKRWMQWAGNWGQRLGNIFTRAFEDMADGLSDALMGMAMDWKAFGRMFIKQLLQMIIQLQIAFALQTAMGFMGGFGGGSAPTQATGINPTASPVSLQHGGEVTRTGWAKVHEGERYSGVDNEQGFGNTIVNISDFAGLDVEVNEYKDSDQRIIDVSLKAAAGNGTYRRVHRIS